MGSRYEHFKEAVNGISTYLAGTKQEMQANRKYMKAGVAIEAAVTFGAACMADSGVLYACLAGYGTIDILTRIVGYTNNKERFLDGKIETPPDMLQQPGIIGSILGKAKTP